MSYPEVKKYAEVYRQQQFFADQTIRVTSAYTNSFSVLYIFDVDNKESAEVKRADTTSGMQKVLAVQSELMVYDRSPTSWKKSTARRCGSSSKQISSER